MSLLLHSSIDVSIGKSTLHEDGHSHLCSPIGLLPGQALHEALHGFASINTDTQQHKRCLALL